ncbi:MAG TPA: hypothetical protein VGE28_19210 [Pseudomonas sp.]
MKPTEKAALIAGTVGLVVGFGLTWLLEGASVWFYVGVGVCFATGIYTAAVKQMAAEKVADSDLPATNKG